MEQSVPADIITPTSDAQSSVLEGSPETFGVDNDISDLLMDSFGIVPRNNDYDEYDTKIEDKFVEDLDQNLPFLAEIFDDLHNVLKSDNNSVNKEANIPNESEKLKEDAATTMNNIQKEIEYEIELDRVERLRKPKFQTMPAYEKRAKQESQWRAAVRAARRASSLHCSAPYKLPAKFSGGSSNLHTVVLPILTKDPVEASSSLNLSSLDLVSSSSSSNPISSPISPSTSSCCSIEPVEIVKSSLMVNTKKHLSAANHFPANSRLFNRSLKQLQSQADAISFAYLKAAEDRISQQNKVQVQPSSNCLNKTTNITRFLKDVNSNQVASSISAGGLSLPSSHSEEAPSSNNFAEVHPFNNNVVQILNNNVVQTFNKNGGQAFRNNDVQSFKNTAFQTYTFKNNLNAVQTCKNVQAYKNIAVKTFNSGVVKMNNNNSVVQTVNNNINVVQTHIVKAPHLPVYSLSNNQVRTPQVLHPANVPRSAATYSSQSKVPRYLLVDSKSSATSVIQKVTPPIHPKAKVSHVPAIIRPKPMKKALPVIPSSASCYNCAKLARVLPYLAHSRRKLLMHSSSGVHEAVMVLVCEICGEVVRETVIFGDYIVLDHVTTAHFPSFLDKGQDQVIRQEEDSQNVIKMGEEWS